MSTSMLRLSLLFLIALALLSPACSSSDEELKEWTVADHNHQRESRGRKGKTRDSRGHTKPRKKTQIAGVTWKTQCANCHGNKGRGDGPAGAMFKVKNLTEKQWQDSVTDEQITESIRKGKGQMPAFNLPESTIKELVAQIRRMGRRGGSRRRARGGAAGPASGKLPAKP